MQQPHQQMSNASAQHNQPHPSYRFSSGWTRGDRAADLSAYACTINLTFNRGAREGPRTRISRSESLPKAQTVDSHNKPHR